MPTNHLHWCFAFDLSVCLIATFSATKAAITTRTAAAAAAAIVKQKPNLRNELKNFVVFARSFVYRLPIFCFFFNANSSIVCARAHFARQSSYSNARDVSENNTIMFFFFGCCFYCWGIFCFCLRRRWLLFFFWAGEKLIRKCKWRAYVKRCVCLRRQNQSRYFEV